jgi:hypothetical protein
VLFNTTRFPSSKAIVAMLGFSMLGGDWRLAIYDERDQDEINVDEIWFWTRVEGQIHSTMFTRDAACTADHRPRRLRCRHEHRMH